ncbi:MAG: NusG domain II-containing protein [Treponema sp.]|nr:NusG domain II-containing protein [Treponema sp.]
MKIPKAGDIIFFLLILGAGIFLSRNFLTKRGPSVEVNANGNKYEYSLSQDGIYQVGGRIGNTTIEIKDGKVRIIDSPCPNKTCVHQNWGNLIICLPNNVIVSVKDQGEFDAIAE